MSYDFEQREQALELALTEEQISIRRWRCNQLESRGVPWPDSYALSKDASIDLHAMLDLLARGCPPHLLRELVQ